MLLEPGFKRETIKIPSVEEGVELDVWLYTPISNDEEGGKLELKPPYPVVVAGHGYAVTTRLRIHSISLDY